MLLKTVDVVKKEFSSSSLDMAVIFLFFFSFALVKIDYGRRSPVVSRGI